MKKLFALILALCLALSLVACSNSGENEDPETTPTPDQSNTEGTEDEGKDNEDDAPAPAAPQIYTYEEDRGDFQVTWTLTLIDGGMYSLDELSGLSGNVTSHSGSEWTDNGDGTITTGPWAADDSKSEFFEADGSCTWIVNGDGTVTPANLGSDEGDEGGISAGKYTYEEDHGGFTVSWEIMLMGNGSFQLSETHGLSGEVTTHTGAEWTDNGDGTATTGPWDDASSDKSDFFAADGTCTWTINEDGTATPVE